MPSNVAMCMLGSIRTFKEDCVARTTLLRLAAPLHADVYAFVNVPTERGKDGQVNALRLVADTVRAIPNVTLSMATADFNKNHKLSGRSQIAGFRKCFEHTKPKAYRWIIRVRTDTYHDFTITSLPSIVSYPVAFVPYLGKKNCVGDAFALLGGRRAQLAYFHDGANALSNVYYDRYAPECAIGAKLHGGGVRAIDWRTVVPKTTEGHEAVLTIVRNTCDAATSGMHWIRPISQSPIQVTGHDVAQAMMKRRSHSRSASESASATLNIVRRLWSE